MNHLLKQKLPGFIISLALLLAACQGAGAGTSTASTATTSGASTTQGVTASPSPTQGVTLRVTDDRSLSVVEETATIEPSTTQGVTLSPMDAFMQGIAYTAWNREGYNSTDSDRTLAELIQPLGTNWISLLVTCYQANASAATITCGENTPSDESLRRAIQTAHDLGLRVLLKPHVDLGNGAWRGEIDLGADQAGWDTWFESYTAFISHYARLAEETRVDYFCVGTELTATSHQEEAWRKVVGVVREIYAGPLVYAANHGEEEQVTWWDALDAIGIDAYYPLTHSDDPSVSELRQAWTPIVRKIGQLATRWERRVIFTEIGYRSIDGANQAPWDYQTTAKLDLQEQADCYQAFFESFAGQPWWQGVFWWNWTPSTSQGGPSNLDYTAQGKPAAEILRQYYSQNLALTPVPTLPAPRVVTVYTNELASGWENWSWEARIDLNSPTAFSGSAGIEIAPTGVGGALSLYNLGIDPTPLRALEFFLYVGETTERQLIVFLHNTRDDDLPEHLDVLPYLDGGAYQANQWQKVSIPLVDLGVMGTTLVRLSIQELSGEAPQPFFVDEIRIVP